ncbi:hypothetical protein ZWY2020_054163 [Hordeum vulgare]|nr:hypothetical protein ZWY2020_054163 [Hordeum vulgare]
MAPQPRATSPTSSTFSSATPKGSSTTSPPCCPPPSHPLSLSACYLASLGYSSILSLLCFEVRRNQPVVDFDMVDVLVRQLKGCSYSVGAKKVNHSCMQFRRFYEPRSKERCLMALNLAWNEFSDVRSKFETMMQLEEQIAAYGPKW